MNFIDWKEIRTVFAKDLLEVLRDYRTLIVMILMPAVIYPAILVLPATISKLLSSDLKNQTHTIYLLGDSASTHRYFRQSTNLNVLASPKGDPEKLLNSHSADIVVAFPAEFSKLIAESFESVPKITIFYDARRDRNVLALKEVRTVLSELRSNCIQTRFNAVGIKAPQKYELKFTELKVAKDQSLASEPVRNLLPFLLFTMLAVAVIYPALDVITGERERNTLPLLLMSPTDRRSIMLGKFLVVFITGMAALIIGLFSIHVFTNLAISKSDELLVFKFPLKAVSLCFVIAIPLVITLSSLAIWLSSWCKTFQQGQGYFVPFLFVAMGASSVCSLPQLKLSSGIAIIPVVNTALSLKEVLSGHVDVVWLSVSFLTSVAFALWVTNQASGILDSERLLFGVTDSRIRRRLSGDYFPEVGLLILAVFLSMFYIGQTLQSWDLIVGSLFTQLLVILLPAVLLARHLHQPFFKLASLKPPSVLSVLGAILIMPFCLVISILVYSLQSRIVPPPEAFTTIFTKLMVDNDKPLWLCLLGIAIAPGICEELLFRGTILGLLRQRMKPWPVCLAVGILFGLFHMSIFRILPTAVLGVVLTGLTVWTGSIVPAMILHILNNASAVLMSKFGLAEAQILNYWYVPVLMAGLGLFLLSKSREKISPS